MKIRDHTKREGRGHTDQRPQTTLPTKSTLTLHYLPITNSLAEKLTKLNKIKNIKDEINFNDFNFRFYLLILDSMLLGN